MDEHQAIRRLKRGEVQALAHLVEVYQVKGMRTAFLITNDEKLAEDLVQEAFLRAYWSGARGQTPPRGSLGDTWSPIMINTRQSTP